MAPLHTEEGGLKGTSSAGTLSWASSGTLWSCHMAPSSCRRCGQHAPPRSFTVHHLAAVLKGAGDGHTVEASRRVMTAHPASLGVP